MSRISDEELRRIMAGASPGPWLAANNPGDWGLAGAWSITPPNGNPYEWDQCIAHVEYTTPYCAGASKAEIDAADVAQANAQLIALAPALAAEVLQLREALEAIMADRPSEKHNGNRNDLIAWQMWRRARAALSTPSPVVAKEGRDA